MPPACRCTLVLMRWQLLCCVWLLYCVGCGDGNVASPNDPPSAPSPFRIRPSKKSLNRRQNQRSEAMRGEALTRTRFRDVHEEAGLQHVYLNGERGRCLLMETTGAGAGWLDFDADGHWDLYLNQGGDATVDADDTQPQDALFRSLGDGTFQDVTAQAGIVEFRYSQAVAVGDYDDDGFDDIYVTNMRRNTLFRNQGDGTFVDVTEQAGVGDERWSASAAWADLDLDGDLDLYVSNYCIYDPKNPILAENEKGEPRVPHPRDVPAWPDECYINCGDGTFSAEAQERGLVDNGGRGLGVAVAGTRKLKEFTPPARGWLAKIWSPGSAHPPSPLKSIQASSRPGAEAVTSTVATWPARSGDVKVTPSSSSLPSLSSPSAFGSGWPSGSASTLLPRWKPGTIS